MRLFLIAICFVFSFLSYGDSSKLTKIQSDIQELKKSQKKVAYVNLAEVLEKTKKGRSIKKRLEKYFETAKKKFQSTEKNLKKAEEDLKKEAPLLSERARSERVQKLQQKILNYQRETKNKELELQKLQNKLMNPVIKQVKAVVAEIGKKRGYIMVKNIGNDVLWLESHLDLTNEVIVRFNKKY